MLYLGGGMRQVKVGEGKTFIVLPDFSDTTQFYYLPNYPHIAKMEDGVPAIRMLVYREDLDTVPDNAPEAVAFLSLDVDLAWPPEVIDEAASKLRIEDQLQKKPRLTPIFFTKGSVKLMLLDAATPDEGAAPAAGDDRPTAFVTKIMGSGSPDLVGTNRAIFQATLTKKGAAALSAALDGVTPIGVVYSLTFAGLQPAFNIKAHVDWQKVYDHFSERKHADFLFYESDIQKSIDKMVDEKAIELEVTVEGVGGEAMDAERESVMNSVRQLIFDKFFEATFKPIDPAGGGTANDIVDTLTHIHQNALTLGVGYTYHRKEVQIEELRTLDLDFTARKAAERTIYPQAHMYNLLTGAGVTKDKLVTIVDGADSPWKTLPFEIMAAAAWDADGIAGITVDIEYEDADSGVVRNMSSFLTKDKAKVVRRDWMDRTSGDEFKYKYEVVFADGSVPGPTPKVDSGAEFLPHKGTALVINPRELYEAHELEVGGTPNFAYERWPAVQAVVRYRADDGSFEHYEDGVLTAGNKSFKTRFRVDKGVPGRREVQLTYIGATGERVETPFMPMLMDQWVVEDPHPDKLVVRAVVAGDRKSIANLLVDLEYEDDENGIHESGSMSFEPENIDKPQSWTVNLGDPSARRYRYRMTLVTKTGDFLQTGWISTDAPSLPVGEVYVRRLAVEFVTGDLARGVEAVEVAVAYRDDVNDVHDQKTFRLGPKSRAEWQVPLKDASRRSYEMTTTWIREDGFNPKVGPATMSDTYVVIPGSPPR
jgi:hypothetical protein